MPPAARGALLLFTALALTACPRDRAPSANDGGAGPRDASSADAPASDAAHAEGDSGASAQSEAPSPYAVLGVGEPNVPRDPPSRAFDPAPAALGALPAGFVSDGDVAEWPAAAAARLGSGGSGPNLGRLWVAFGDAAVVVAGDVLASAAPDAGTRVHIDLAFAPSKLPPLAFVNHLTAAVVDDAYCRDTAIEMHASDDGGPAEEDQATCRAWLVRMRALRAGLGERFVRHISVDLATERVGGVEGAKLALRKREGGGTFELTIPAQSLPETAEMPLRTVRVAARVTGPAAGKGDGGARRWRLSKLDAPRAWHAAPEIVARILSTPHEEGDVLLRTAASYVPAPTTSRVGFFFNAGAGGQWSPDLESPQVGDLDVAHGRKLLALPACGAHDAGATPCAGDVAIEVWAHPVGYDDTYGLRHPMVALVSRRAGKSGAPLDMSASTSFDPYGLTRREPGVHVVALYQGPAGPYGTGPSGAMPGHAFQLFTMDARGHFTGPRSFDLAVRRYLLLGTDGLKGFGGQEMLLDTVPWFDPKLEFFGLRGSFIVKEESAPDAEASARSFEVGYRWDAAARDYVRFGRLRPREALDAGAP